MGAHHGERFGVVEGWLAGEELEGDHCQPIAIGSWAGIFAADLFRAHVRRRAELRPDVRDATAFSRKRQSEVGQRDVVIRSDKHIAWLDVPMYQAVGMGMVERAGQLREKVEAALRRESTRLAAKAVQGHAVHPGDDDVGQATVLANVEHFDDVWMTNARHGFGLSHEAYACLRVTGEVRRQDLERHAAIQVDVMGANHQAQRAAMDQRLEAVAIDAWRQEARESLVGHGAPLCRRAVTRSSSDHQRSAYG